jgi:hypothetical protein
MGFFNLYKPRQYDYRYIYYDPAKEKRQERDRQLSGADANDGEYRPSIIKRGVFREMAERNRSTRVEQMRKTNIRLIVIVAALLAIAYFLLK